MALLGMGSNMENNGYFRQRCLVREIAGNGIDCAWPRIVDDELLNGRRFSNSLFPRLSELDKGVLKQIMLNQESIFRDQIYELHRLYQRQRDLMAELQFRKHDRHEERTSSRASDGYDRTLSISTTEKIVVPSIQVKILDKCLHPLQVESESKCRKFGKKILDLELPAEEYIDGEEEWPVKENLESIVSEKTLAKIHDSSVLPALSGKLKIMADLNEPIKIEDEVASESQNLDDEQASFGESDRKLLPIGARFDLNRLGNEDGSSSDDERSRGKKCDEEKLEQEDGNRQEELVRIAAEVMISISFDSLLWFSSIVCSTIADDSASGNEISGDQPQLPENGRDYFEAMTLKLKEMKPEDEHLPENNAVKCEGKIDELSSNGSSRRKGRYFLTVSPVKRMAGNGKPGLDDESRVGWGRKRRRKRGRRSPARNPQLILGQILKRFV